MHIENTPEEAWYSSYDARARRLSGVARMRPRDAAAVVREVTESVARCSVSVRVAPASAADLSPGDVTTR